MTTEEDFQRALDSNPEDHHTRLVFADWLQERDDPRAEGYRALGKLKLWPLCIQGVWFYHNGVGNHMDETEGLKPADPSHALPPDWFKGDTRRGAWTVPRKNRRNAENTAARLFAKLPPNRRAELLALASKKA